MKKDYFLYTLNRQPAMQRHLCNETANYPTETQAFIVQTLENHIYKIIKHTDGPTQ